MPGLVVSEEVVALVASQPVVSLSLLLPPLLPFHRNKKTLRVYP